MIPQFIADHVGPQDACWPWTGRKDHNGYGAVSIRSVEHRAHRVAYEALIGPIPVGLVIDHLCRNRECVNPRHMEPVTPAENTRRGESFSARYARQTHCKRGHEYTEANTYLYAGKRLCRACRPFQRRPKNQPDQARMPGPVDHHAL